MNIKWITIRVSDYEKSKEFYENFLKLEKTLEFTAANMKLVFYKDVNGMEIELIHQEGLTVDKYGSNISVGISTFNFNELLEKAKSENRPVKGPMVMGKAMECFFVEDPDGVPIQIIKGDSWSSMI